MKRSALCHDRCIAARVVLSRMQIKGLFVLFSEPRIINGRIDTGSFIIHMWKHRCIGRFVTNKFLITVQFTVFFVIDT